MLMLILALQGATTHYVFFGRDRDRIRDTAFLANAHIAGAQLKYMWWELEPQRDTYDFRKVTEDLALLERYGKRLFVQVQDVSFSERERLVPDYLRTDPAFGGGVARKYEGGRFNGLVARRWDPAVRARFIKLLEALGRAVDGRVEGVNLAETAIGVGERAAAHPAGFTYEGYVEAISELMTGARAAFPRSQVIVYANFMPGEWLPDDDHGYLRAVYAHAERIGVGVGGPDLLPNRAGQRNHSLRLIAARGAGVTAGLAVQDGNLAERNRTTGERVTVAGLARFATDTLRLNYIFWGTEEPFYSAEILPYLARAGRPAERP